MKIKDKWVDNPNKLNKEIGKLIKKYIKEEQHFDKNKMSESAAIAYGKWRGIDEVFIMLMEID